MARRTALLLCLCLDAAVSQCSASLLPRHMANHLSLSQEGGPRHLRLSLSQDGPHPDFQELCERQSSPLLQLPFVKPSSFCSSSGLDHNLQKCELMDRVEATLINVAGKQGHSCRAQEQHPAIDTSPSGVPLPYALSDQRPLPESLPGSLMATEGASYYFVWRALHNFNLWAGCAADNTPRTVTPGVPVTGDPKQDLLVAPGWTVHSTHWQADGTELSGRYWPFAAVMHKGADVIIVVRGSQTQQDWISDFSYNTTTASLQPGLNLPSNVHQGFATVAASLWPGIQSALQSLLNDKPAGIENVFIAGHSLGAGVATLLSYGVQVYLPPQVKVNALLFAVPNAGDQAFAAAYNKVVNARRLPFELDIIPQVPCSPSMVACGQATVPTRTGLSGGLWQYSPVGGTLLLEARGMPQQPHVWGLLDKIHPCQMKRLLEASHVCSYNCFMSQFVNDGNSMCKLWDKNYATGQPFPEGPGSYCTGFPAADEKSATHYPYII